MVILPQLIIRQSLFPQLSPSQVLIVCIGKQRLNKLHSWSESLVLQFPLDESNLLILKSEFDKFLVSVYAIQQEKKEKEEASIIGNTL